MASVTTRHCSGRVALMFEHRNNTSLTKTSCFSPQWGVHVSPRRQFSSGLGGVYVLTPGGQFASGLGVVNVLAQGGQFASALGVVYVLVSGEQVALAIGGQVAGLKGRLCTLGGQVAGRAGHLCARGGQYASSPVLTGSFSAWWAASASMAACGIGPWWTAVG